MKRLFEKSVFAVLALVAAGIAAFAYEEAKRASLLKSYVAPADLVRQLQTPGVQSIGTLLKNDESLMCLMDAYGTAEGLSQLNASQRNSLPKSMLPSEDVAWYLIFLTGKQHTRIYLLDKFGAQGLDIDSYGCLRREESLLVVPNKPTDGLPALKAIPQFESKGK
jgi:hypothetical protein